MKKLAVIAFGAVLIWALAAAVLSAGRSESNIYLTKDQVVKSNYYQAGATIEIAGKVENDVVVAGGNIIIAGEVGGDVLAIGGNVRITGPVAGNVRVIGGNIELAGPVGKNVSVAGGTLNINANSLISGHLAVAVGALDLRGVVKGNLDGAAGGVIIAGTIKGATNLLVDPQSVVQIRDTAIIDGLFTYRAGHEAQVAPGAKLAEPLKFIPFRPTAGRGTSSWWLGQLVSLFGLLVIGMVVVKLLPRKVEEVAQEALVHPWFSLAWGLGWAVLLPLVALVLFFTIIGVPLAIILGAFYIIGLVLSQAMAGASLGWYLKSLKGLPWFTNWSPLALVLLGTVVFRVLTTIPWLGGLILLLGILWGWGALLRVQRRTLQSFH